MQSLRAADGLVMGDIFTLCRRCRRCLCQIAEFAEKNLFHRGVLSLRAAEAIFAKSARTTNFEHKELLLQQNIAKITCAAEPFLLQLLQNRLAEI